MEGLDNMEGLAPLVKARLLAEAVASCLPESIPATALPLQSKIPFKVLSLREVLFHRVSALASPAVSLLESGNLVAGILLARAVMETVAFVAVLGYELKKFVKNPDVGKFDAHLTRCLLSNRLGTGGVEDKYAAENIMHFIDTVSKKKKGYRTMYLKLCEFAHPNYDGVLGSFGSLNRETFVLALGQTTGNGAEAGSEALAKALDILVRSYDGMVPDMEAMMKHFEPDWRERPNGDFAGDV